MTTSPRPSWLRRTGFLLLTAGTLCVAFCCAVAGMSFSAGRQALAFDSAPAQAADSPSAQPASPEVMARLEIPRIGLAVPVLNDYNSASLLKGVGHIPGTALPGGLGTVGLAGHRDTYFRPLARIRPAMEIKLVTATGTWHYAVDSTEIVKPEKVAVLDIVNRPALTLVTCYPFHYIGAAPLRFIVHAHLLSLVPDAS